MRRTRRDAVLHARTDVDGRYRVSGHSARELLDHGLPAGRFRLPGRTEIRTDAGPPGRSFSRRTLRSKKAGSSEGRSSMPIPSSRSPAPPSSINPNAAIPTTAEYDLSNTVLTDTDGRFAITALPGQGFVAVETPDESYMRVPDRTSFDRRACGRVSRCAERRRAKPAEIAVRKGVS